MKRIFIGSPSRGQSQYTEEEMRHESNNSPDVDRQAMPSPLSVEKRLADARRMRDVENGIYRNTRRDASDYHKEVTQTPIPAPAKGNCDDEEDDEDAYIEGTDGRGRKISVARRKLAVVVSESTNDAKTGSKQIVYEKPFDLSKLKLRFQIEDFTEIGAELTYGLTGKPDWLYKPSFNESLYETILNDLDDHITKDIVSKYLRQEKVNKHFKGYRDFEVGVDGSCIEISTPSFANRKAFIDLFNGLGVPLLKRGLQSSSLSGLEDEGGCHLNIQQPTIIPTKDSEEFFKELMFEFNIMKEHWRKEGIGYYSNNFSKCINKRDYKALVGVLEKLNDMMKLRYQALNAYIVNHPSVAWYFLSPHDNVSSRVVRESDGKGDILTKTHTIYTTNIRNHNEMNEGMKALSDGKIESSGYVEWRMFMMPRNVEEHELHTDFAQALNKFINIQVNKFLDEGKSAKKFEYKKTKESYTKYTYKTCVQEMKKVCAEIGFDYNRFLTKGVRKDLIVKVRMSYGNQFKV